MRLQGMGLSIFLVSFNANVKKIEFCREVYTPPPTPVLIQFHLLIAERLYKPLITVYRETFAPILFSLFLPSLSADELKWTIYVESYSLFLNTSLGGRIGNVANDFGENNTKRNITLNTVFSVLFYTQSNNCASKEFLINFFEKNSYKKKRIFSEII